MRNMDFSNMRDLNITNGNNKKTMDMIDGKVCVSIGGKDLYINGKNRTTDDIRRLAGIKKGRQILIETPEGMISLRDDIKHNLPSNGKYKDSPGIRKAADYSEADYSYGEYRRDDWCNQVILQQIEDLEKNFCREDIMVDNMNNPIKIMIPHFKLPEAMKRLNPGYKTVPLIIVLPDQYPFLPPVGFYLPEEIKAGKHSGFSKGYHGAYTNEFLMEKINFKWYCSSVIADTWQPANFRYVEDWKNGDNLWHVITLISEVLSDFSDD